MGKPRHLLPVLQPCSTLQGFPLTFLAIMHPISLLTRPKRW